MMVRTANKKVSPKTDKAFDLWILLQQARDAAFNARDKELGQYGLSAREAAIFRAINMIGRRVTPAMIARWVYRKPHTVGAILRRMEKKGYLELSKDPAIRNIVRIKFTAKGKKAYKDSLKRDSIHRVFKYDKEKCRQLEICLTEIRDRGLAETGDKIQRPLP